MYLKIKTLHCWCFGIELFHFKESGAFKITANIFAHPVYCCYNTCTLKSSLLGEKKKRLSPVRRTYIHTYTDFRKISRRRVYFPSPIFPHPSPCRHSHFPIWWTIKRLLQQFFLSKLHSTLPRFLFENSIKKKKNSLLQSWILFREKKKICACPPKKCFRFRGLFHY